MAFFEDVWSRNFLNIFGSPITIAEYVTRSCVLEHRHQFSGTGRDAGSRDAIFRLFVLYGVAAFRSLLVLFLFGIALGIIASALVLRLGPSAEWLIWPIPALISPFAGVFYPLEVFRAGCRSLLRCCLPAMSSKICGRS